MSDLKTNRREKLKSMQHLTEKIKDLLLTDARYKDSDTLLVNRVQRDEMVAKNISIETSTIRDFFMLRLNKVITSEDTITRCRRAVQEYYPETRGLKYKARQSKQVEVIDNLKENKNLAKKLTTLHKLVIAQKTEVCDFCQGSGKYESYPCNVCSGVGYIVIN